MIDKVAEPCVSFIVQAHQSFNPSTTAVTNNQYVFNLHTYAYVLLMFPPKDGKFLLNYNNTYFKIENFDPVDTGLD